MRRHLSILTSLILSFSPFTSSTATPPPHLNDTRIPLSLFASLEELSRIVDISYCVGTTGISSPFTCGSRCDEFPDFELVDTFNTGPLMSDSCGYIVLDHSHNKEKGKGKGEGKGRVIVAFRGTYSVANTIVDLSTIPQEYVPYPGNGSEPEDPHKGKERHRKKLLGWIPRPWSMEKGKEKGKVEVECYNCTVHTGFWTSWQNTRPFVLPHLKTIREKYPNYKVELVGHSLGGAVASLAGLEFEALGWEPMVTTFGEPRVGNEGLRDYVDAVFGLNGKVEMGGRYRRVTHVDDPVPLLPLQEWGYRAHAGEVYISKVQLQPGLEDLRLCDGDEDVDCIAGAEVDEEWFEGAEVEEQITMETSDDEEVVMLQKRWGIPIPARYKMWQLFFAHRDYFWRLGLCVPGGDPLDWGRERYDFGDGDQVKVEL
jgi:hypothetical protein